MNEHITGLKADFDPKLKTDLNEWIYRKTNGIVQSGPFKGMKLLREENWHDGNLGCKVLGCYEMELHTCLEQEIERLAKLDRPTIFDIGCAEGFYVVGMARRLPKARLFVFDIDSKAYEPLIATAVYNDIEKVHFGIDAGMAAPDLVICDCEGAETLYLDKDKYPALAKASIIVECHDFGRDTLTQHLINHFHDTHKIHGVDEGGRNPNAFPMLTILHGHVRAMAVSEGRPFQMHWLYMVPK